MDEEQVIQWLLRSGSADNPYGEPINDIARGFRCPPEEVEAFVKQLEVSGKIKQKIGKFQLVRDGESTEHLKYSWVRPGDDLEKALGDYRAR